MSQDVTKVETQLPATLDYSKYAGQGTEQATAGDYALPFLAILQKLSPQCDENNLLYIGGGKAGMVIEMASGRLLDGKQGINVVPCYFRKDLVEWTPREGGGGFVKSHGWQEKLMEQCERNDRGQLIMPNGNLLVDTKYHYVLVLLPDGPIHRGGAGTSEQQGGCRRQQQHCHQHQMTSAEGK